MNAIDNTRVTAARAQQRQHTLIQCNPTVQAEIIATHYAKNAKQAAAALELLKYRDPLNPSGNTSIDQVIAIIMSELKRSHIEDLGIPLEWPTDELTP